MRLSGVIEVARHRRWGRHSTNEQGFESAVQISAIRILIKPEDLDLVSCYAAANLFSWSWGRAKGMERVLNCGPLAAGIETQPRSEEEYGSDVHTSM